MKPVVLIQSILSTTLNFERLVSRAKMCHSLENIFLVKARPNNVNDKTQPTLFGY